MTDPETPKRPRGRPLKNPNQGPMSAAQRNAEYRRKLVGKRHDESSGLYLLAHEWCLLLRDLEHRDPGAAALLCSHPRARIAAERIMGAEDVQADFEGTPISVLAQKHRDGDALEWARRPHDEDDVSEGARNNF